MSLSANFLTELQNVRFRGNIIVSIDGTYFSQYLPDSGLAIDDNKVGLLDNARINGVSIDIRRANTPISTINFDLLDKDSIVSTFVGNSETSLQNAEVKLYFGFMTGSFDFSDYALIGITRINGLIKEANGYKFRSKEVTDLIQRKLLETTSVLDGGITDIQNTLDLIDALDFPTSGRIKVNSEFMQYTGKAGNTLTGVSRGDLSSTIAEADDGDTVEIVTEKNASSMDILLDVLINDLSIDPSLIDQTAFTSLRDNEFSGEDDFLLYIYDVPNALKWIESRILDATNTRIFSVNGVISIGLLDQVPKFETLPEINEDHVQETPSWSLTSDKIVNRVIVKWAWNEGLQKFSKTTEFKDDDSIAIYGERKSLTLKLYGVFTGTIVSNRAARLLSRFSTPKAQIKTKTHFNRFNINVADNVRLINRFLPQAGGTLGFNDTLEVMSKTVSGLHSGATITFNLEFSSYTGIRIGLISPSPKLDLAITDQKTFEVPDGACYGLGYWCLLFDNVNNIYFSDVKNKIIAIDGNIITFENDWTTPLGANVSLYFTGYDDASGDQKAIYAWTAPETGVFEIDGSKAYQVIF